MIADRIFTFATSILTFVALFVANFIYFVPGTTYVNISDLFEQVVYSYARPGSLGALTSGVS